MITISGLVAGYGAADPILRGVDLTAAPGAVTCVVGPNGAGKSTVLKACSGLLRPRSGRILLDGDDLAGLAPAEIIRRGVVQVPQHHGLFPALTVRENVMLGAYVERRERERNRRRFAEIAELFPIVAERAGERAANLSGGQRRAVEFARALMLRPKVVLLDEPSVGLDPRARRQLAAAIGTLNSEGVTVLIVEQNVKFGLSLAHDAVVMEGGKVLRSCPAPDLLADPGMAALFLGGGAGGGGDEPKGDA
ncbi:branched-chain amino acid transport system ATP-binding protein [Thermocatellispora tengchongensis]|uniref:Branched-chain amino acid transport system ATP-binding protein n=1 Tax=Thermocatellispora tengchongensis TaxID=1073253 RepID=A0A840P6P3_9ACTN|nr:ABC transporter ATP-binding protein [Thermocatellispora tengchongensis]MBB5133521.1 branched-chain amino acid transport system ATP-binding protein [Thermocatellispora tengchongensis]